MIMVLLSWAVIMMGHDDVKPDVKATETLEMKKTKIFYIFLVFHVILWGATICILCFDNLVR